MTTPESDTTWLADLLGPEVFLNGEFIGQRRKINLIGAISIVDNPGAKRVDVTLGGVSGGGGGGGSVVVPDGSGDWTGSVTSNTVGKLKGTGIGTAGGALAVGLALITTGVSTADWGKLDGVAGMSPGGANKVFVSNAGNTATAWATSAGDWTGAVSANIVGSLTGLTGTGLTGISRELVTIGAKELVWDAATGSLSDGLFIGQRKTTGEAGRDIKLMAQATDGSHIGGGVYVLGGRGNDSNGVQIGDIDSSGVIRITTQFHTEGGADVKQALGGSSSYTFEQPAGSTVGFNVKDVFQVNAFRTVLANVHSPGGAANSVYLRVDTTPFVATPGVRISNNASLTTGNQFEVQGTSSFEGLLKITGPARLNTLAISNKATGGSIGSAASTVDLYACASINQTTGGQTVTIPDPTDTTNGRMFVLNNDGNVSVGVSNGTVTLAANDSQIFIWQSSVWSPQRNIGILTGYVPTSRLLTAGAGLTGGGDLSADRTFDVVANADGSIVVNPNDIQVGVISDAQHGARGGGTQHSTVTNAAAGFATAITAANRVFLSANGTSAVWGQVDLSTSQITGTLPAGNQAAQTMAGDVTGTTAASTVVGLTGPTVAMHGTTIQWDTTVVPTIKAADVTTNSGTGPLFTIQGANETGTGGTGGGMLVTAGDATGGSGTRTGGDTTIRAGSGASAVGRVFIKLGAVQGGWFWTDGGGDYFLGLGNDTPGSTVYAIGWDTANLLINAKSGGKHFFRIANADIGTFGTAGLRVGDAAAATDRLEVVGDIGFDNGTTGRKLYQKTAAVGQHGSIMTVQAQSADATSTDKSGGTLNLKSGAKSPGTGVDGSVALITGTTSRLTVAYGTSGVGDMFINLKNVKLDAAVSDPAWVHTVVASGSGAPWNIVAQDGDQGSGNNDGGPLNLIGGRKRGTGKRGGVRLALSLDDVATLGVFEPVNGNAVVGICGSPDSTAMPASSGNNVAAIKSATTVPSANPGSGWSIVYGNGTSAAAIFARSPSGFITQMNAA